tara:strand:+ start:165 stop:782 length:618 start_codon:yes stop_codon:yes gene_type:complete
MKSKNIIILSIFISYILSSEILENLPSSLYEWELLENGKIIVWNSDEKADIPWARARALYPFSTDEIYSALKDLSNYKNIFDRVTESKILDDGIVYIRLDMPLFLADRDYTVKYLESGDEENIIFQFFSVKHPGSPDNKGSVTLPRAAGEWVLKKIPGKGTQVTYTWNGELLGNFPSSSLHKAWKEQGTEVLTWLYDFLKKNKRN